MNILSRLLARIDSNLEGSVERHLRAAGIPEPRSISPDEVVLRYLPSRFELERMGSWAHCFCCAPGCGDRHRDSCPLHQATA